ncbi:sulfite exporter TauE/SafE family protein [Achromobacter xylosoxidans]|uniref:sulfite exporter TauE/SafE family protein n=1 Tax=Alcaligenes xylosoxydans xylosoxydans TaxID=85698 RepID=UPI0022B93D09|nr:sulfite exporter TauE/SafE family protein [Achromobacter xylosoxidans]MCZ8438235.1 sulfite exporter TauE/SafE family protein [Achromobacter xylosoxidans]
MSSSSLLAFLLVIAIASYLQALTGFALGLFALGGVIALNISSIATASMVINVLMVVNVTLALRGYWSEIHKRLFWLTLAGLIPGAFLGIFLLQHLEDRYADLLQMILGILILVAGATMAMLAQVRPVISSAPGFVLTGILGGVCGGMYSIPGPPVVYLFYRQPLPLDTVRSTLLAVFGTLSVVRLVLLTMQGEVTADVLELSMFAVPVVIVVTALAPYMPLRVPDQAARRIAFVLLGLLGLAIVGSAGLR